MGHEIEPNIVRTSSAGLVYTHDEMVAAVEKNVEQRYTAADSYEAEAPHAVKNITLTAEWIGRNACSGAGKCGLKCSGVSLVEQNTLYDGQVKAVCNLADCDDRGVAVAFSEFKRYELHPVFETE
jgi:hypothetical protein